ncbi:hypothetical protein [Brevundimonas sp.]|uniref:8-oxoguanine DNA glycosylase n=1 Tax=Brevundimonas sp. TaxID=1871086 RepID=UPI001A23A96E|nr:hypothetical protein [Brevundimonas sp.]MBJ7486516.1 hypothetical protein [Brevundimonas sp.]
MRSREFPPETQEVVSGVQWGSPAEVFSPAYWALQLEDSANPTHGYISESGDLVEEVGFCLLGGFSVKVELAEAYHRRLLDEGVYSDASPSENQIFRLLSEPAMVEGRSARYRFPGQRAERLALAVPAIREDRFATTDAQTLRRNLQTLKGVGPKTASWIVRNHLGSDDVAILDIHVVRACQTIGLFPARVDLVADYDELEATFLDFAKGLGARASILDAVIWNHMREFSPRIIQRLT